MLTAEENILLPLELARPKPDPAWVDELLDHVGPRRSAAGTARPSCPAASSSVSRSPGRSSPGRRSLFADEPTGNLDSPHGWRDARAAASLRSRSYGQTTVMVTHDAARAAPTAWSSSPTVRSRTGALAGRDRRGSRRCRTDDDRRPQRPARPQAPHGLTAARDRRSASRWSAAASFSPTRSRRRSTRSSPAPTIARTPSSRHAIVDCSSTATPPCRRPGRRDPGAAGCGAAAGQMLDLSGDSTRRSSSRTARRSTGTGTRRSGSASTPPGRASTRSSSPREAGRTVPRGRRRRGRRQREHRGREIGDRHRGRRAQQRCTASPASPATAACSRSAAPRSRSGT